MTASTVTAASFFDQVPPCVTDALPEGVAVTFDLTGRGGGTWTVERNDAGATRVVAKPRSRPDCFLRCTTADFQALVSGELDPRDGFMEGRFEVEGDVGLVLALHRCLQS